MKILSLFLCISLLFLMTGCSSDTPSQVIDRESKIPSDIIKVTQESDINPPKSLTEEYEDPMPLPYPISTAGAEDSAFMLPDGNTIYFFFTPDVRVPVEKQVIDKVTGIYVSRKINDRWQKPERVVLNDMKKADLDGCEFVQGNIIWFCSVREGYTGINWFTAENKEGIWKNWKKEDFNPDFRVGELHITSDGNELYFHSERPGGKGGLDIWVSKKVNGIWQEPLNLESINTIDGEGWPSLSPDGNELWFSRNYAVWRSKKVNNGWQTPIQMFSPLAGESSIDNNGDVYFTHHFYKDNQMIEADIYVAKKR